MMPKQAMQEPRSQTARVQTDRAQTARANCLALELTGRPQPENSDGTQFLDLYLSLDFREAEQKLGDGRFKFGLAGGKLKLKLDEAKINPGWRTLLETTNSTALPCQVAGTEAEPTWIFAPQTGSSILNGSLEAVKLLTLQAIEAREGSQARPISIEAIFEVQKTDLRLIEAEGLWPHDISPNKHAVLEQKQIQFLLQFKFQPYASRVELQYTSFSEPPKISSDAVETSDAGLSQLEAAIARVVAEGSDRDFLALASLAELNPAQDFAGAKLVATDLRDIDLSGVNLSRANLRGADLTDTDLNGANLSGASLAGADLSGAMLGDANLKGANLQRCSLALANLGGANLAGANLQEANLSNANLSDADLTDANLTGADLHQAGLVLTTLTGANLEGANVTAARFKKDRGISEDMERNLKQRGAIFEDE